jgi:hypothetical protein
MLDITTLAAWGEFIGGIAVVVSLIYLASQIRQNSKLLRVSTASATTANLTPVSGMAVQDPEVGRIWEDGTADRESLSQDDRRRFDLLMARYLAGSLQQYEFIREGIALPLSAELGEQGLGWQMQQRGAQHWWRERGAFYPQEFRDYVDDLIRKGVGPSIDIRTPGG